jgi:ethanolamine utilization protein EutA (predicted chaperonin)
LARRDLLEPQARIELFAEIAAHFRSKVQFPPESTDGIADEQFVRNVVDSLYRSGRGEKKNASATANIVVTP